MLHAARSSNGFGPNPIAWSEIWTYCQLMKATLDPWEVEAIKVLDAAYIAAQFDNQTPAE